MGVSGKVSQPHGQVPGHGSCRRDWLRQDNTGEDEIMTVDFLQQENKNIVTYVIKFLSSCYCLCLLLDPTVVPRVGKSSLCQEGCGLYSAQASGCHVSCAESIGRNGCTARSRDWLQHSF